MKNSRILTSMKLLNLVSLIIGLLLLHACATSKKPVESEIKSIDKIQVVDTRNIDATTDAYTVSDLKVEGDVLTIAVCYGSCAEHDWKLLTNKLYKKSLPPQLDVYLIHDQHDDLCKRRECDTLYFDISDVKYPGKENDYTVTIKLFNTAKTVNYDY